MDGAAQDGLFGIGQSNPLLFTLPRELRNNIYSLITTVVNLKRWEWNRQADESQVHITKTYHPDVLRVSRQFREELEEVRHENTTIAIIARYDGGFALGRTSKFVPNSTTQVELLRHIELRVPLCDWKEVAPPTDDMVRRVQAHLLALLPKLPKLRTVRVQFEVNYGSFDRILKHQPAAKLRHVFTNKHLNIPSGTGRVDIGVTQEILITGRQFEIVREFSEHTLDLECDGRNWIRCRATLAKEFAHPYAWNGMELQLISCSEEINVQEEIQAAG